MKFLSRVFAGIMVVAGFAATASAQSTIQDVPVRRGASGRHGGFGPDAVQGRRIGVSGADTTWIWPTTWGEVLGVKLEIVDATWATLIPGLVAGRWDIALVDMFATPKRAVTVMFTDQYFQTRMVVMGNTRENKRLADWEALNSEGRNIVVLAGTADEQVARDNFPDATVNPMVAEGSGRAPPRGGGRTRGRDRVLPRST